MEIEPVNPASVLPETIEPQPVTDQAPPDYEEEAPKEQIIQDDELGENVDILTCHLILHIALSNVGNVR